MITIGEEGLSIATMGENGTMDENGAMDESETMEESGTTTPEMVVVMILEGILGTGTVIPLALTLGQNLHDLAQENVEATEMTSQEDHVTEITDDRLPEDDFPPSLLKWRIPIISHFLLGRNSEMDLEKNYLRLE
jgi:hypothetical protein